MERIYAIIVGLVFLLAPSLTRAQDQLNQPRDPLHVYLITYGPGSDPWEKFGHDCIVFRNDRYPHDAVAYNWGVFDFGQGLKGFLTFGWHFLQGRLSYSMEGDDADAMLAAYKAAGRSILIQELRLTPVQKQGLLSRLEANDTDANRYYLYDYFKKNCTTMARDAIDQTVDGRIAASLKTIPTTATYRWHDRRTTADDLWLYIFLDYALGQPVDRRLSAWDESFLPGVLAKRISSVQVPDENGKLQSIVMSQTQFCNGVFAERSEPPASYFYGFLASGIGIGGAFALLAVAAGRLRVLRWVFNLGVMVWSTLAGALGAMCTFAWFTNHDAAKWNENWFQGNPLSLLMVVLAPLAFVWPSAARRVALIIFGLSVFGLIAKLTPWFWQVNGSLIALALPIHAGIAWGILRLNVPKAPVENPADKPTAEVLDAA